jgi:hypothetical protein
MKKKLPITLVFLYFITVNSLISAQTFTGGALLGINASQVDGDNYAGYNKLGFMGGAYVYTSLSRRFDLQMEIKYMGKGANKPTTEQDLTRYTSNLHYIEIPVLVRLNTKIKLGWEAGLGFGYLFSFNEKDENGLLSSQNATQFKPFELSYILGASYQFAPKFLVNLRYSYSVLSIAKKVVDNNVPNMQYYRVGRGVYNNLFSIGLYYTVAGRK